MSEARTPVTTLIALLLATFSVLACAQGDSARSRDGHYEIGDASRDGIGKFYLGREIAHVMGHRAAMWLERDGREREERTDLLIDRLPLEEDSVVADIGAGTGYFSFPVARRVPKGKVFAVDIQPEMLAIIRQKQAAIGTDNGDGNGNVEPRLGSITDVQLPENSVDLAFIVDAYHEFSHPVEMGQSLVRALKPGGRLVLIEYRGEDPTVPIKPLHKMTQEQARREMEALGLAWERLDSALPQQHMLFFRKPE
ncbi:class I SAM-dependent methyltransferase [Chromatocurvus halotolerans]|uniref:Methyltransferase family protein n=1 Tax=Chromatocurvus halotolerans TaxID=1132028 RepID=A0A4R2KSC3_9GAMM|nr:class I SAM-dependent methyltransferase [Chromatocurvus halotolerans]TCO76644.1 methyltransferase family protein [Chromatocurvus halotolerans]